jgi:predicted nucleotidyltransferase
VNQLITKDQINRVVETIVQNIHPDKVILFGSYANGNPGENSDLGLLKAFNPPHQSWMSIKNSLKNCLLFIYPKDTLLIKKRYQQRLTKKALKKS